MNCLIRHSRIGSFVLQCKPRCNVLQSVRNTFVVCIAIIVCHRLRKQVWEASKQLWEQFGKKHTVQWYQDQIMYGYIRNGMEREVNPWNAFIHMRTKEKETGMPSFSD